MATYNITTQSNAINFGPENETIEILQNVQMILTTVMNSVPLDRTFGIEADYVDKPLLIAQARLSAKIYAAIKSLEARAKVTDISFTTDNNTGELIPNVKVVIV